jgi:hypothetical protein
MHDSVPIEFPKGPYTRPDLALWHFHYMNAAERRRRYENVCALDWELAGIPVRQRTYLADIQGDEGGPDKKENLTGEPFRLQSVDDFLKETGNRYSKW